MKKPKNNGEKWKKGIQAHGKKSGGIGFETLGSSEIWGQG